MIETYKILHNLYDHNCSSLLKLHSSFYFRETRDHRLKLYHEHSRLKKRNIVSQSGRSHYGTLPEKVALAPALNQFNSIHLFQQIIHVIITFKKYLTYKF